MGLSATTSGAATQLGLATMPLWPSSASSLTSGTTSGTCGSMRKALELSITTAPDSTAAAANWRERVAPAEKSAIWMSSNASCDSRLTTRGRPR